MTQASPRRLVVVGAWLPLLLALMWIPLVMVVLTRVLQLPPVTPLAAPVRINEAAPQRIADSETLQTLHLFGVPTPPAIAEAILEQKEVVYEETTLSLRLVGVFTHEQQSGALIADQGGQARRYALNDELPESARLVAVKPYYVVLERNGVRESLHFDKASGDDGNTAPPMQGAMAQPTISSPLPTPFFPPSR